MVRERQVWRRFGAGFAAAALGTILLAPALHADDAAPPARAVRLTSVEGHVQVSQGAEMLADPALSNMPLFEGSQVTTLDDGRAEIQFEDGSLARVSPNSSATLNILRGQSGATETEITAVGGLAYFELQGATGASIRVRFADAVVSAAGFTVLRVSLDNPPGDLAVFTGNAHVERGGVMSLDLHGGENVALSSVDASRYNLSESIEPDSWDAWNSDRDQVLQNEYAAQTGAAQNLPDGANPAWADLDANGNWYNVPSQGYVWSPDDAASADWDPYGNGYWMYTPRFGYMWVSGNSWGYLPYQCGLWNYYDSFGWGWAPGMCNPWWGGGGWFGNVGFAPGGYRFPRPPGGPHPVQPHRPTGPGSRSAPYPVVAVSRRLSGVTGTLPARGRDVPVVIAGHSVRPLAHPGSGAPRQAYDRTSPVFASRNQPAAGARPGQPGNVNHPANGHPSMGTGGQHPAPVSHSSGGSSGGSSHAPAPGGGGGGGGSHGGGGGGGGGGSHR